MAMVGKQKRPKGLFVELLLPKRSRRTAFNFQALTAPYLIRSETFKPFNVQPFNLPLPYPLPSKPLISNP
jgi:hypothetical protein